MSEKIASPRTVQKSRSAFPPSSLSPQAVDQTRVENITDNLTANLAARLEASSLPSDGVLSHDYFCTAANFLLTAAAVRVPGSIAIVIDTQAANADRTARIMRMAIVNDDMPFLVDSIAATITAQGHVIDRLVHPVVGVSRDASGKLLSLPDAGIPGTARESMIYIETRRADARSRSALAQALEGTLKDVRAAVADWNAMITAMGEDSARLAAIDRDEGASLLRWLQDGMLTQLGHVLRYRDAKQENALGICRTSSSDLLSDTSYTRAFAWFDQCIEHGGGGRWPLIVKSNRMAEVHRRVPLDLFIIPLVVKGRVKALSVHAGVWTSAALSSPPTLVPQLRSSLTRLMEKHGFSPSGHAGKALAHALTKLPHDLLIGFPDHELERVALMMMGLIDRPRPRLALVPAPLERQLIAFVWLPRDSLSTALRLEIVTMLEASAGAKLLDWSLDVEGSSLAQLIFLFNVGNGGAEALEAQLDSRLQTMLRGWVDAVESELGDEGGRAAAIAARFAESFPIAYRNLYGAGEAATDIVRLRHLSALPGDGLPMRALRLYRLASDDPREFRLKVYQRHGSLTLSDAVPAIENFGFRVIDTVPTALNLRGEHLGTIHDFLLQIPSGSNPKAIIAHTPIIEEAMNAVANDGGENDAFNHLIVAVGLSSRETNWLRAWYRYLRQAGMNLTVVTVVEALAGAPMVTLGLIDLFRARHQGGVDQRDQAEAAAEETIRAGLAKVSAINDDRLLRAFRAVVMAILRTNSFTLDTLLRSGDAKSADWAIAFKIDSSQVPGLPRPVPWREIFVYSARVEGIHLRAGPVARGGLRWSDRRDDFRTEVLGLMKAQRVKNAVIVPTGAKGGFYPKHLPDPSLDRDGWAAEGRGAYQVFVRTLLSLTDNIIEGKVVHPEAMVIRDGEDPYFVVAADKGTATFSDTANALAGEADFWLDDAFASGGSKGYDHKAMGITARGAWLSVQRHCHELGFNIQKDTTRVVGVGDMSGDVFGNGMLLSETLKVVAAFDHRHIFLDPNPDAGASHAERARMFALPRSSWEDYNKALISKGGGVFPRSQKEIPLSDEVREALDIKVSSIDPEALMRAILTAPVELLWFGGIGTYVKGCHENNVDVGDPSNDAIRINGSAVRARVIGEGANLGCTQAARIEYALLGADGKGGRNNTDFIDNSAGVDCSDKEVNIKIALASARRAGRLDEDDRVALLIKMTEGVSSLVLEDNRLQALALSVAEAGGPSSVPALSRLIETLEAGGQLDRVTEGLGDSESLQRRASDGRGLTRPELAVLLSSTKLVIQDALEHGNVVNDEGLTSELLAAFPEAMREAFRDDILSHRLRREIIATRLANRMVNRMGFVHPFELAEEEGVGLDDIASAFVAAERLFAMGKLWHDIETCVMSEEARILLFTRSAQALRTHMADLLRSGLTGASPTDVARDLLAGVNELSDALGDLLTHEAKSQSEKMMADLTKAGVPRELASALTRLFDLDGVVGLARLGSESGTSVTALAHGFTALGSPLGLDWAQGAAARMDPSDPWEGLLVAGLARDFQQMRLDFLRAKGLANGKVSAGVAAWLRDNDAAVSRFCAMTQRARAQSPSPVMLAQIASQARNLLAR